MKRLLPICLLAVVCIAAISISSESRILAEGSSGGSGTDAAHPPFKVRPVATFSIVAIDPANGDMGVTVASRYFSVGSVVPWAEASVGAVATQADVNVGYGPKAIKLLEQGLTAQAVLKRLLDEDIYPGKDGRQVAVVDVHGNIAAYTGPNAPHWAGDRQGKTWSAQGNILVGPQVPESMGKAFDATQGELAEKLYAALKAGDAAGGDARGRQSASMLVVRKQGGRNTNNDRYIYINVDDNPNPFAELRRLLDLSLAYNYQDQGFKLLANDKMQEARDSIEKAVHYSPNESDGYMSLGFVEYALGHKDAALQNFQKAKDMDPKFADQFKAEAGFVPTFKKILDDSDFMQKLFPKN
jgi:uncharacterized Ntn-hydrolase superfamily protein